MVERPTSFEHEQKLIKIDDFNNEEEEIIKKWVEKRKKKEARGSWKKVLKRQKKAEKEKIEETELWPQLKL